MHINPTFKQLQVTRLFLFLSFSIRMSLSIISGETASANNGIVTFESRSSLALAGNCGNRSDSNFAHHARAEWIQRQIIINLREILYAPADVSFGGCTEGRNCDLACDGSAPSHGKELRLIKSIKTGTVKATMHRVFKNVEPLPRFHGRNANVHNMQRYRLQLEPRTDEDWEHKIENSFMKVMCANSSILSFLSGALIAPVVIE